MLLSVLTNRCLRLHSIPPSDMYNCVSSVFNLCSSCFPMGFIALQWLRSARYPLSCDGTHVATHKCEIEPLGLVAGTHLQLNTIDSSERDNHKGRTVFSGGGLSLFCFAFACTRVVCHETGRASARDPILWAPGGDGNVDVGMCGIADP